MLLLPRRRIACHALRLRAASVPQVEGGSRPSCQYRAVASYATRPDCVLLVPQIEGGSQAAVASLATLLDCAHVVPHVEGGSQPC